ncbi:MAG: calcium/sodium antiporter [Spirochaetales bacterium]|nr:calcium/sodium antiporter [Spirochaetales bacterium]
MHFIPDNIVIHFVILAGSFFLLSKSADFLVDGSVGIAAKLKVPKMIIGIVLVGFATTAPEFSVSVLSALKGHPEIALGNAVGSVIADDALALALGIIVAPVALKVDSRILKSAGIFLICIDLIGFGLAANGVISRLEGLLLVAILAGYLAFVVLSEKKRKAAAGAAAETEEAEEIEEVDEHIKPGKLSLQFFRFGIGVAGVLIASEFLVDSSLFIARFFGVPEVIIGLTMIAIGTSIPEIATCIVASRKGHGDLALGDIIGADILNILWIVGAAAVANPIVVDRNIMFFAFPVMILVVLVMLLLARAGYTLQRWKGFLLLGLYGLYLTATVIFFYLPS